MVGKCLGLDWNGDASSAFSGILYQQRHQGPCLLLHHSIKLDYEQKSTILDWIKIKLSMKKKD